MKKILLAAVLAFCLGTWARAQDVQISRSHTLYGFGWTKGDGAWSEGSPTMLSRSFTFLDSQSDRGGWYYGWGASVGGSVGEAMIADTWLATWGWMGNPLALFGDPAFDFDVHASVSPTLGSRIVGREFRGAGFLGVGVSLGAALPVSLPIPLVGQGMVGITWDPVIPVARVFGSRPSPDEGYANFAVTWVLKTQTETRALPW